MLLINQLTSDPIQNVTLTGIPGIAINMTLRFMPRVQRWFMSLSFGNPAVPINGLGVVTSPNMLRQYRNQVPFGIACLTDTGLDPYQLDDFAQQASNLYLLNAADVQTIEEDFYS